MNKTRLSSMLNAAILKISMGQTNTHTHTQNDYRNPRCACAPRVNYAPLNLAPCGLDCTSSFINIFLSSLLFLSPHPFLNFSCSLRPPSLSTIPSLSHTPLSISFCCVPPSLPHSLTPSLPPFFLLSLSLSLCRK